MMFWNCPSTLFRESWRKLIAIMFRSFWAIQNSIFINFLFVPQPGLPEGVLTFFIRYALLSGAFGLIRIPSLSFFKQILNFGSRPIFYRNPSIRSDMRHISQPPPPPYDVTRGKINKHGLLNSPKDGNVYYDSRPPTFAINGRTKATQPC